MQLDLKEVEELAKTLYIRALKLLPGDIKQGFEQLLMQETNATGKTILGTMVENIAVAERTKNLLCQDTGIPIYNVTIGRHVEFDGAAMKEAIRRGCAAAALVTIDFQAPEFYTRNGWEEIGRVRSAPDVERIFMRKIFTK